MDAEGYHGFMLTEGQPYLPLEVNTGNGANILPRKWFGINPNTETHEQLSEVHCPISIASENISGKSDQRLTPAKSISVKFPHKAQSGARSFLGGRPAQSCFFQTKIPA